MSKVSKLIQKYLKIILDLKMCIYLPFVTSKNKKVGAFA